MQVVPFPKAAARAPLLFALGARFDLRIGAPVAGVVRPAPDTLTFSSLSRVVRAARMAWRQRSALGQISLALPAIAFETIDADTLEAAAIEAGCTRGSVTFEFDEAAMIAARSSMPETLRARGWGVALAGDSACPLPFGAKARNLYTELVIDAPPIDGALFTLGAGDESPLARRILAAKEAGMLVTAEGVESPAHARLLAIAGIDRGAGRCFKD